MKPTTIFITYNPNIATEHTLAVRLHTIGAVNGFLMYLPDRYNSNTILDTETKQRINKADYLVFFSLGTLSQIVKQEIAYAFQHFQDKSKIIVIYDAKQGKNLEGELTNYFTPFYFNRQQGNQDILLNQIITTIFKQQHQENQQNIAKLEQEKQNSQGIMALLGIGLGLFILSSLAEPATEPTKTQKSVKKKK